MKREDIVGTEVTVILPRGERFDCFVAEWNRMKGITIKLIDNNTALPYLPREKDGSYNLICINRKSKNPAYGPYYEGFFNHITKRILTGTVTVDSHHLAIEGIVAGVMPFGSMMTCAF